MPRVLLFGHLHSFVSHFGGPFIYRCVEVHSFIADEGEGSGRGRQQHLGSSCIWSWWVHSNSFTHSRRLNMQKSALQLQKRKQKPFGQPPRPLAWPRGKRGWGVSCRLTMATGALHCVAVCAAQSSQGAAEGRTSGKGERVVPPPQIACKLVKVWIYVRNIVCSCYAHTQTYYTRTHTHSSTHTGTHTRTQRLDKMI